VSYGLAQTTGLRVFAGSYRAVTSNSNAFPAQMLDLLSAYGYVMDQGFSPANILIVAESAGAFFCLAMMRHLSELRSEHSIDAGMPGAVLLMSVRMVPFSAHCSSLRQA
jgi:acetyl esterase/lipase